MERHHPVSHETDNADLAALPREQLERLVLDMSKNVVAMDGVWFQSVEDAFGMGDAMEHDCTAAARFEYSEARRLKRWLGLDDHPGLVGLEAALRYKYNTLCNSTEMSFDATGALVFRVTDCRVQSARKRKGLDLHPCKDAGLAEYRAFAEAIDERISCECLSCHPDVSDPTCACAWRFTL